MQKVLVRHANLKAGADSKTNLGQLAGKEDGVIETRRAISYISPTIHKQRNFAIAP